MRDRVHIESTARGIRRIKSRLEQPQVRQVIAAAGMEPVERAAAAMTPVGTRDVKRYAPRKVKGKANRPSSILKTTSGGNLKASLYIRKTSAGLAIGPRMYGTGTTAVYAAAVHAKNPFLLKAQRRASDNSIRRMIAKLSRMIKSLDV